MFEQFRLDQSIHDRTANDIFAYYLDAHTASSFPRLVVLGGQPGSGKSLLAQKILTRNKNMVFINGDELRSFHPKLTEISMRYPLDTAAATDADVRRWTSELFEEARSRRIDILFEGTLRTSLICETIDVFFSDGYRVDIVVAAVHPLESRFSIFARYLLRVASDGYARFTPASGHEDALSGMPNTLRQIVTEGKTSSIMVVDRNGDNVRTMRKCEENLDAENVLDALSKGREEFFESGRFEETFFGIGKLRSEIDKWVRQDKFFRLLEEFDIFVADMESERRARIGREI